MTERDDDALDAEREDVPFSRTICAADIARDGQLWRAYPFQPAD